MRWLVNTVLVVGLAGCAQGSGGAVLAPATGAPASPSTAPGTVEAPQGQAPSQGAPRTAPAGPDTPVTGPGGPEPTCAPVLPEPPEGVQTCGEPAPAPAPTPQLVEPREGMENVRPLPWETAEPIGDGTTLRVSYWSGVAPCAVLDRAEATETGDEVIVTLFQGSDPRTRNQVCIEIAEYQAVDVALDAPLDGRTVVDGAE